MTPQREHAAWIAVGAVMAVLGIFVFGGFGGALPPEVARAQQATRWTEPVGEAIVAPACGSSSIGAITCVNNRPSVPFSWTDGGSGADNVNCLSTYILANGVVIADSQPCSGSFTWQPATNNATVGFEIRYRTANQTSCSTDPCGGPPGPKGECTPAVVCTTSGVTYPNGSGHVIASGTVTTPNCIPANSPPAAAATISTDNTTFTESITVVRGVATSVFLSAAGSSDPNGWTDPDNGVSSGGMCEWNRDLDPGSPPIFDPPAITNPATPEACNIALGSKIFNDPAGTHVYQALRITDRVGAVSNIDPVSVVVTAPDLQTGSLNVSGTLIAGSSLSLSAVVSNPGNATAGVSETRAAVDINNDGSLDVIPPHNTTGPLSPGANESEDWPNAWTATAGTHRLEVCADVTSVVNEGEETNNCSSTTFAVAGLPDLLSESLAVSGTQIEGSTLTLSGTVRNAGGSTAAASVTRVRVDVGNNGSFADAADVTLPTNPTAALAAGASEAESFSWVAVSGTHRFEMCADYTAAVTESNETNNCAVSPTFTVSTLPNLTITAGPALASGALLAGSTVTFDGTVTNSGGSTANGPFPNQFQIDLDNDNDPGSPEVTLSPNPSIASLAPGVSSVVVSGSWTVVAGTHRLTLCADAPTSAVIESNAADNCSALVFTASTLPDLIVESSSITGALVEGNTLTLSGVVTNQGGSAAGASTARLRIDVGNNGSFGDAADVTQTAATGLLAPLASETETFAWIAVAGSHRYEICADSGGAVAEGNEANNCRVDTFTVSTLPDLVTTAVGPSAGAVLVDGNTVTFTGTISNNGGSTAGGTFSNRFRIDVGNSGSFTDPADVTLAGDPLTALAAGAAAAVNSGSWVAVSGSHRIELCADEPSTVTEPAGTNCLAAPFSVSALPDLLSESLAVSGTQIEGSTLTLSGSVRNAGGSTAAASVTRVRVDVGNNGSFADAADVTLPTNPTAALAAGASEAESFSWVAVSGTHRFEMCADSANTVTESDAINNCAVSAPFTVSNLPDLIVESSAISGTLVEGGSVTISGVVKNIGGASAGASATRLRMDLSNPPDGDFTDPGETLGTNPTAALPVTATEIETFTWTAVAGTRNYEICADSAGAIGEGNEANNCRVDPITITALPDLIVESSSVIGTPVDGNTLTIRGVVKNNGGSTAGASATRLRMDLSNPPDGDFIDPGEIIGTNPTGALAPLASEQEDFSWLAIPGTRNYEICADSGAAVSEDSETNNCRVDAVAVSTLPDLVVTAIGPTTGSNLVQGSTITFDGIVRNNGGSTAGGTFSNRFEIDQGNDGTFETLLSPDRPITALAAGSEAGLTSGSWVAVVGSHRIRLCADAPTSTVTETNGDNNCAGSTFAIATLPDLVVSVNPTPTAGSALVEGNSVTFQGSVKNNGGSTAGGTFSNRFQVDIGNDGGLPEVTIAANPPGDTVTALAPAAAATVTSGSWVAVTGSHRVILCADEPSTVTESDGANNCNPITTGLFTILAAPDLTISVVPTLNSGTLVLGTTVDFKGTVKNQGGSVAGGTFTNRFVIDLGNDNLGSVAVDGVQGDVVVTPDRSITALAAGASQELISGLWTVTQTGTHRVILCADSPSSTVTEADGANNCNPLGTGVFTVSTQPDLVISAAPSLNSGTLVAGDTVTFKATVRNQGGSNATGNFDHQFTIDIGNDGSAANDVGLTPHPTTPTMQPAETEVILSGNWVAVAGTHRIIACADAPGSEVVESDETNNCNVAGTGVITVAALPDLVVPSGPTISSGNPVVGSNIRFRGTVRNIGGSAAGGTFDNRFQIDLGNDGTTPEVTLPTNPPADQITALATSAEQTVVSGEWTAVEGTHRVILCADAPISVVTELDGTNNCNPAASGVITITRATLSVAPSSATIAAGTTLQLQAYHDPDGAGPNAPIAVTELSFWTSSSVSIASVTNNSKGLVTGNFPGQNVQIRAEFNGLSDTAHINVIPPPDSVFCSPASQTVTPNAVATLSAEGGLEPYTWSAPGGTPGSGSGPTFATSYATDGAKTVTVTDTLSNQYQCIVNVVGGSAELNIVPFAEAGISRNGVAFSQTISVTRGVPTAIFLSADRDVTGDGLASGDGNGWTPALGVSANGRCEWNRDLDRGNPPMLEHVVDRPAAPTTCNLSLGSLTFNDPPGTYDYAVLRIVDNVGAISNVAVVTIRVRDPGEPNSPPSVVPGIPFGGGISVPPGSGTNPATPAFGESPAGACTSALRPTFTWAYSDSESDPQLAYELELDNNSDFSSPEIDTGKVLSTTNAFIAGPGTLAFNTGYFWRVKAWDALDAESDFVNGPSFSTQPHQAPATEFTWSPGAPNVNQPTDFDDTTTVFGSGTTITSRAWTFSGGAPSASDVEEPRVAFSAVGPKLISLIATDSDDLSCGRQHTLFVSGPGGEGPPDWREIPPE